jgi:hypothetical protein
VADRASAMMDLKYDRKFISIEPVMDFDLGIFDRWIEEIAPIRVAVGYDNWSNCLPEPPLSKTLKLIKKLEEFTCVNRRTLRQACVR